ncbi:thiol-disulfide oxidoreductase DCC family protein [Thalassotalea euphylliae]|uniref:thiol-disulfide oxidoreductase DCC family protein n=1 Tax=Thalassotalea euphylliae TaxID=1655234 RepID=UPI00363ABB90
MSEMILFYDGNCPLCMSEISALQKRDVDQKIAFENLHDESALSQYPEIEKSAALSSIHGILYGESKQVITGIDVNYHAWRLVGKKHWVAPLKWKITRPFAKLGYKLFAANRHTISTLYARITGKYSTTESCDCGSTPRNSSEEHNNGAKP